VPLLPVALQRTVPSPTRMSSETVPALFAVQVRVKSLARESFEIVARSGDMPVRGEGAMTVPEKLATPLASPEAETASVSPAAQVTEVIVTECGWHGLAVGRLCSRRLVATAALHGAAGAAALGSRCVEPGLAVVNARPSMWGL